MVVLGPGWTGALYLLGELVWLLSGSSCSAGAK